MQLRVMTYNILNGAEGRENDVLEVIRAANPDVVVLQEVYTREFLEKLAHELQMGYFFLGDGNKKRRVGFISRYPVASWRSNQAFPTWRNFIEAKIEYRPNETFRLIGVHPIARLSVFCEAWRWLEMGAVMARYRAYTDEPCLIVGDFNAIAPHDRIGIENMPDWLKFQLRVQGNRAYHFSLGRLLAAGFTDCYRSLNADDGFTLPAPRPNSRLDYCFVNDKMRAALRSCRVVREPAVVEQASDHCPVIAEFEL
jgi:exonuclease III